MTVRDRSFDPTATALSAVRNASRKPATREDLRRMLETGSGEPSHLRALFGDVDLHTLCRLAALFAIDNRTLARSYVVARRNVAAANAELDEFAAQFDF
jgi:nitroreductase